MNKHYEKIDGLRFIAIFLVLLEHFAPYIGRPLFAGFYGVDLFFVISGFLVTTVLLKSSRKTFGANYLNFIARRTLRIFPIYYLAVLLLFVLNMPGVRDNIVYLLTYTFNYAIVFKDIPITPINPFWSLCVEEQFYLFWPFVVLSLKRKPKALMIAVIMIIIVGYSQQIFGIFPSLIPYNYYGLLTRMAALGLGALGSLLSLSNKLPSKFLKNKMVEYLVLSILILTLITTFKYKMFVLGLCSLYLVLKSAFYEFSFRPLENLLKNKTAIYIGTISYGIYIFHMPMSYYLGKYVLDPFLDKINYASWGKLKILEWHKWIVKFPIYAFFSVVIAMFSYKYFEEPFLRLKNKFRTD